MNHCIKNIFLLLIWGLALMQGAAWAHTASSAVPAAQISESCPSKVNSGPEDCCSEQLCLAYQHDLGGDNCCRYNNIPVFGLPAALMLRVHPALLVTEKPVTGNAPYYLSSGYHFIWLPPKIA